MSLPTGEEEDDYYGIEKPAHSTPAETDNALVVTPEMEQQAGKHADEIIRLAEEVEIMAATRAKLEAALNRSEVAADILEGKMLKHVPIIKHVPLLNRIGIPVDALIGLIPVVGDAVAASAALYIVTEAHLAGVPWSEIKKMLTKIAIDSSLGAIPVVGDVFDYFYKSNKKNVEIFRKYVAEYVAQHEGKRGVMADVQAQQRFDDSRNLG